MTTIQQKARDILNALDCHDAELSILIVDDPQIAILNKKYLHRYGPTNVIAFPMGTDPFANISPQLLGDHTNRPIANLMLSVVVVVSILLGVSAIGRAVASVAGQDPPSAATLSLITAGLAVSIGWPILRSVTRARTLG